MDKTSPRLAIQGGSPVRTAPFPAWPPSGRSDWGKRVAEVVQSGAWGRRAGGHNEAFEHDFARSCGVSYAVTCTSGTVGLALALKALGIGYGEEVLIPAYTFIASANSALFVGATPVFVDVDPRTMCIDPSAIEARLTERTRAIMPVHLAGCPCDMASIHKIAERYGLAVVEDACQAHGAATVDGPAGSLGDVGVFSFQSGKNMTAGEGGIVVTKRADLYERILSLHNCGRIIGGAWYEHPYIGGNFRLTEIQAVLLRAFFEEFEATNRRRDDFARRLEAGIGDLEGFAPLPTPDWVESHGRHLFMVDISNFARRGVSKARLIEAANAEGIPLHPGYIPLHMTPAYRELAKRTAENHWNSAHIRVPAVPYDQMSCPVAEKAYASGIAWLPHTVLLSGEEGLDDVLRGFRKLDARAEDLI